MCQDLSGKFYNWTVTINLSEFLISIITVYFIDYKFNLTSNAFMSALLIGLPVALVTPIIMEKYTHNDTNVQNEIDG